MILHSTFARTLLAATLATLLASPALAGPPAKGTYTTLPSETPASFKPVHDAFDYETRDLMIPMRDGAKLHTVILVPKGAKKAALKAAEDF